ncbi:MAG: hypothetical protein M1829_003893 [Trizodia sp. TS-e1964]|nr:MAG: hypothetical protein M1829_003893 [Trizodia sp. TS-e1964]
MTPLFLLHAELSIDGGNSYLSGNFAPIHSVQPLTACPYSGSIPEELVGGQYVRNGGNPLTNEHLGRDAHWFDGDGMLSGVAFRPLSNGGVVPEFVNQYILTDIFISSLTSPSLRTPIPPSIATLVNPLSSVLTIIARIFRTLCLVLLSNLWGSQQAIKRISVANTNILYHDGRALATCESGPPMRISLPKLETVGWFDGNAAEGEPYRDSLPAGEAFGGNGLLSFLKEYTTAHPRVDPRSNELILFHSTIIPPFVYYSILPGTHNVQLPGPRLTNAPVPGVSSGKLMHDFGVSARHTIILDLPLSLDITNLAVNKPIISFDPSKPSRFGVFPRWQPDQVRWFETNGCCIFHTANTWDDTAQEKQSGSVTAVNMLACRLTSASLVYSAGNVAAPTPKHGSVSEKFDEQCRLYYFQFDMTSSSPNNITHQWALSAIPFEFPSIRDSCSMSKAKFIYGCSVSDGTFGAALGRAVKIDSLVKVDTETLIQRGKENPPPSIDGCVDCRSVQAILDSQDPLDPIKIFRMPAGWYAQESRFVPRNNGASEDDGWILSYVFDESQLDSFGEALSDAHSELWIIDARNMRDVVARIRLPQRVPYGLHGAWFSAEDIRNQRPIRSIRSLPHSPPGTISLWRKLCLDIKRACLEFLG